MAKVKGPLAATPRPLPQPPPDPAAVPAESGPGGRGGHLDTIARGGFFNLAGSVVAALATMAFTVVVTRAIAPEAAGTLFALTSTFVIVAAVCRLGVPTGLVYAIARYRASDEVERIGPVVRHASLTVLGMSMVAGSVGLVAAEPLAALLVGSPAADAVSLVRLLSATVLFSALTDVGVGATRGFGVMRPLVVVDRIARPVAQLLIACAVVAMGSGSVLTLGVAWVLPFVPSAVVLLIWANRLRRRAEHRAGRSRRRTAVDRSAFWRFTGPRSAGAIAQIILQRSDIVLLGVLSGPRDAAIYAAATRFLVFGQLGAGAISTTIQPKIAHLLALGDREAARLVYRVATVWLVLMAWPVYLVFAVFAPELLVIFGPEYRAGASVIVILSLVMLVATACGAVDVVLAMAGKATWTMGNSFLALAANVTLNVLLIPPLGFLGATIAWAAAILINNIVPLTQLALSMRLHPFGRSSMLAAGLALACFGVVPGAAMATTERSILFGAAATTAGVLTYLVSLWRWRQEFDLASLAAVRRRPGRQRTGADRSVR